jgi:RNA 3'-terminal phosphate cyclase (ATP)
MLETEEEICIDASCFEGGGQMIRNSVALAALLKKKVRVYSIRSGRPKPGLATQHLKGLFLRKIFITFSIDFYDSL